MPCASAAAVMVTKVPKGVTTGLALQCLAPRLERPAFLAISARCSGERTENECAINCDFCFSSLVAHSTLSGEKGPLLPLRPIWSWPALRQRCDQSSCHHSDHCSNVNRKGMPSFF